MTANKGLAFAAFFILLFSFTAYSQSFSWIPISPQVAKSGNADVAIVASKAAYFQLEQMQTTPSFLATFTMEIPTADGTLRSFSLAENSTMSDGLKEKFPAIKSYDAIATDGSGYLGKVDFTPKGFHAMLFHPMENTQFVDPLYQWGGGAYIAYRKNDFSTDKQMKCEVEFDLSDKDLGDPKSGSNYNTCVLRTYRIAIAATGEYTIFHGGTVALALAAQVTTMNRVNGVYERDFGVTMTLVPNNDEIIFTNPSTDPYTNGQTFSMISENGPAINNAIGFSNYDIGHVFGTNSGGLAGFGVTCDSNKASGVTGNSAPIGDPFDIDYVAHEIGHQFGASHTFNNECQGNRSNSTAVEPGSGSTIMAYAGICDPNVQSNSDDHFHGVSMRQIGAQINADNCPVETSLSNFAPVLDSVTTDFFVPAQTPFALTAYAFDPDEGDLLTYNFEQTDNEISEQPPVANSPNGPMFRSFSPTTNPTQYFPRLETLTSNGNSTWEVLSSVNRSMTFRCSVKDNAAGGGCAQYEDLEFEVVANAGPFLVTQPNVSGVTWEAFTQEEVTWEVANTNLAPINADLVDLFLSVDGGISYPILLAEDVPNNGSATVTVPNIPSVEARVMVMNAGGTFFDISNNDFTISGLTFGFLIVVDDTTKSACVGENLVYDVSLEGVGGFGETIELSLSGDLDGVDALFADNTLMVGESTTLTLSETDDVDAGILEIIIAGVAPSFEQSLTVEAGFNSVVPEVPVLTSPVDGAEFLSTELTLDWESSDSPDALYTIEVSEDPTFTTEVMTMTSLIVSDINPSGILPSTVYYWRVMKETTCSVGDFSEVFSFSTHSCFPFVPTDVPIQITPAGGEFTSVIEVPYEGIVQDINVENIQGTHGNLSQVSMSLFSPSGTEIVLFDQNCSGNLGFSFGFDDASLLGALDCPTLSGESYLSQNPLSGLIGESTLGEWSLVVTDNVQGGGGSLESWSIEICIAGSGSFSLSTESNNLELCQGESTTFSVSAAEVFAFDDPITLSAEDVPAGITVEFNPTSIAVGESSLVTLSLPVDFDVSTFTGNIKGESGALSDLLGIQIEVNSSTSETVELLSPVNGQMATSFVLFDWEALNSPSTTYTLDVAMDIDFNSIYQSISSLPETSVLVSNLPASSSLFWRVQASNGCTVSDSPIFTFETESCGSTQATEGLPASISPVAGETLSVIENATDGVIENVTITQLEGTHFRISDLTVSLISPAGTSVTLFSEICDGDQDFNLGFIEGGASDIDCPPTTGFLYAPLEALTAFEGEDALGNWTLNITDNQSGGGGMLNNWGLEFCFSDGLSATAGANAAPEVNIFPNPFQEVLSVKSEDGAALYTVSVLDMTGRTVHQVDAKGQTQVTIDLSTLAKGGYMIEVQGSFGRVIEKVIRK